MREVKVRERERNEQTHLFAWKHLIVLFVELADVDQLLAFELIDLNATSTAKLHSR